MTAQWWATYLSSKLIKSTTKVSKTESLSESGSGEIKRTPWLLSTKLGSELSLGNVHECVISHFSHIRLCNPMNCSLPVSSVHGILQPRILEWIAMYVLTVSGTSFPHLFKSNHSLIVHGSNNPPSLLWSLFCALWLENKQTYTAMWSDSFTDLLSPCQLGPQHCLVCLI